MLDSQRRFVRQGRARLGKASWHCTSTLLIGWHVAALEPHSRRLACPADHDDSYVGEHAPAAELRLVIRKRKGGWGRPTQRSSDDAFSSFWPSELSPSLPSIGFLITRFWTIGAGALVGPGGDIGPRAWILRAGAPATTAPPLGGR